MLHPHSNPCTRANFSAADATDLFALKSIFAKPLSRLAVIENEIAIAARWIQHLEHDKNMIVQSLEKFRTIFSRTRSLPDDILREIFLWCLPATHNASMSAQEAPMLLTRVCRRWRDVALSTPRLWAALHITVPSGVPAPQAYDPATGARIQPTLIAERRLRRVGEWLARSGQVPLHISLHQPDDGIDTDYGIRVAQKLLQYTRRMKALTLQGPPNTLAEFARLGVAQVPLLERLHILPTRRSINWRSSDILRAPLLRDIEIHGLLEGFADLPLVWEQITHLTLAGGQWLDGSLSLAQIGIILTRCKSLISCTLKLSGGASISRERRALPPIVLPALEQLIVYEMQAQSHFFFDAIEAARLEEVQYWFDGKGKASPSGFSTLLTKVGKSVQKLKTNPVTIEAGEFYKGIRACNGLTALILRESPHISTATSFETHVSATSDLLLKAFTHAHGPDGGPLCPQLDTLECSVGTNFSDEAITEFITRKLDPTQLKINKLKVLKMVMTRWPSMDIAAILGHHATRGLQLDIRYSPPSSKAYSVME